jgi:hypothetical protein
MPDLRRAQMFLLGSLQKITLCGDRFVRFCAMRDAPLHANSNGTGGPRLQNTQKWEVIEGVA